MAHRKQAALGSRMCPDEKTPTEPAPATGPAVAAVLRNTAIGDHRGNGETNIARATRRANRRPDDHHHINRQPNPPTRPPPAAGQPSATQLPLPHQPDHHQPTTPPPNYHCPTNPTPPNRQPPNYRCPHQPATTNRRPTPPAT